MHASVPIDPGACVEKVSCGAYFSRGNVKRDPQLVVIATWDAAAQQTATWSNGSCESSKGRSHASFRPSKERRKVAFILFHVAV